MSPNYSNNILLMVIYLMTATTVIYGQIPKADSKLKFAIVIFRHGDRAPFFTYKTNPYPDAFPEGPYGLTKLGKQHMYKKGQIFRRLYDGYLSKLYLDNEIYTSTTNVSRTHMTAAMVLAGLYPPTSYQKWSEMAWQPIPVYGGSPDHGDGKMDNCPAFNQTFQSRLIKKDSSAPKSNLLVAQDPLLSYLSKQCGQPIEKPDLFALYDLFTCQLAAGLELPEWTKPDVYEQIKSRVFNNETTNTFNGNEKLQNLFIGPLLKEITSKIQQKSGDNTSDPRKMYMYSGHDFSIVFMSAALGHLIEMPKFGASLHFHVYRFDDTDEDIIKVYYLKRWDDAEGEELSISNCNSPCKVADFINMANNKFTKTWEEECNTY